MVNDYAPGRWFPLVFGLVAGAGLLSTLLPMWSVSVHQADLEGSEVVRDNGGINLKLGFYDWVVSGRPVGAVLPLVLALAVAVAVAAALCVPDRIWWGVTAAAGLCAVIVVGATAIRPNSRAELTGRIGERMSPAEAAGIRDPAPMDVDVGAGLVLALLAVAVIGGLAAWQCLRPTDPTART